MLSLKQKIKELQSRPYEAKLKILWTTLIIAFIFLIAIWLLTLKFRKTEKMDGSKFTPIKESFQKLKDLKFK